MQNTEYTTEGAVEQINAVLKKHSVRAKSESAIRIWFQFKDDPSRDVWTEATSAGGFDNWVYNSAEFFIKENPWTIEGKQNPPMMLAYRYIKKFGGTTK